MPLTGAVVRDALFAVGADGKQLRSLNELAAGVIPRCAKPRRRAYPRRPASFLSTCAQES